MKYKTRNEVLFARMSDYTQHCIYNAVNNRLIHKFKSFDDFMHCSVLSHHLDESLAFSTALSYVYTMADKQVEIYMDIKSPRCDFNKAAFVKQYTQHVLIGATKPVCPLNWGLDQYTRMLRTMEQFFNRLFSTDIVPL